MAFSKSRSVSLWVTRVDYWFSVSTGGFLLPRILSVLIRLPLSAESWPSDIISPHSPLIKGRNDKSWQCSDRNLPRWVLFMHASLTARRPACSGMVTPPPPKHKIYSRGAHGSVGGITSKMRHDPEVKHTGGRQGSVDFQIKKKKNKTFRSTTSQNFFIKA